MGCTKLLMMRAIRAIRVIGMMGTMGRMGAMGGGRKSTAACRLRSTLALRLAEERAAPRLRRRRPAKAGESEGGC